MDYSNYEHLEVKVLDGVALITMNRPESLNSANFQLHYELSKIWLDIGNDDSVKVAVITGSGNAFSAGGDFEMIEAAIGNPAVIAQNTKEAGDIVYNLMILDIPVISAINGVAVGAGLAVALLADISIASEKARITDGHTRLGVAAGDHAAMIWPLLCGMAKAKYYLLTCDFLDGSEAERIGLVSRAVPHETLMDTAMDIARKLSHSSQPAIRYTKHSLNQWLRQSGQGPFDYSLLAEAIGFFGPDIQEGLSAIKEKRTPKFPSAS